MRSQSETTPSITMNLNIYLGGQQNPQGILIQFNNVLIQNKDLETVQALITQINTTHISATQLNKTALKSLNDALHQLMQYSFMTFQHGQYLRAGLQQFFQNEINAMPRHPIELGNPGYEAYQLELGQIHQTILTFSKTLQLCQLPLLQQPMTLNIDHVPPPPPSQTNPAVPELPSTLSSFTTSIATTPSCKQAWEARLRGYPIPYLESYFRDILSQMQKLARTSPQTTAKIIMQIRRFINLLDPTIFAVNMLRDVAKFSISPVKTLRRRLPTTPPPIESQSVFQPQKEKTAATNSKQIEKCNYELRYNHLICSLKRCIQENISHEQFGHFFTEFSSELLQMIQDFPLKKFDVLRLTKQSLGHYHDNDIQRCRLGYYLDALERRVRFLIPQHLINDLRVLKAEYSHSKSSARQRLKYRFLIALEEEIRTHPEKTYAACIQHIKATPQSGYHILFPPPELVFGCSFFPHHRFKQLLDGLKACDPQATTELHSVSAHSNSQFH